MLQHHLAAPTGVPETWAAETFLSVAPDVTVQKGGIEFGRTEWFSPDLREAVLLPPRWRGRPLRLELRYDAAALSRNMLKQVVLLVRDEHDAVIKRVVCIPRDEARRTLDREDQQAAAARYDGMLNEQCAEAEAKWIQEAGGVGAATRHRALQRTVKRSRGTVARGAPGSAAPETPAAARPTGRPARTEAPRTAKKASKRGTSARGPSGPPQEKRPRTTGATIPKRRDAIDAVAQHFLAADAKGERGRRPARKKA